MTEKQHSGRFAILPTDIIKDRRLGSAAVHVFAALALYADPDGNCWPSTGAIAELIGKQKSVVRKQIRVLEQCGYLKTTRQKGEAGVDATNRYKLMRVGGHEVPLGGHNAPQVGGHEVPQTIPREEHTNIAVFPEKPGGNEFEVFQQTYPKRNPHSNGDKKAAEKKFWLAIEKKGATVEFLHKRAREYADYVQRENVDPKFVVQATRYFNEERWKNDDYGDAEQSENSWSKYT